MMQSLRQLGYYTSQVLQYSIRIILKGIITVLGNSRDLFQVGFTVKFCPYIIDF